MKNIFNTLLVGILVIVCTGFLFGQDNLQQLDANSTFVVNPNPHEVNISGDVIPVEEIFASNQSLFAAGPRSRGNLFTCTTARKIIEHRMYLNPTVATQMWFCIYEGATQVGIYNLVHSVDVSPQGIGEGWYTSGPMEYDLIPGMFYLIYASFEEITGYWNENPVAPYPVPATFGELTAGAGWNYAPTANFPPDATQDVLATAFAEPVAYYQTIVTDDITGIEEITSGIPSEFSLFNNYPNPFNPATTINFVIPEVSFVEIKVYDVLGSEVATILNESKEAGYHHVQFDATNLQSGIYFYQLQAGSFAETKKMILLK